MKDAIYWIDQYAKKDPHNLDSYATCVVDGYKWRLEENGKTYCAGKVEKLLKKEE
tara:strand:- start:4353 stop:4517 length:165 start_codon:yes stop_codon:yes gene_type:complete